MADSSETGKHEKRIPDEALIARANLSMFQNASEGIIWFDLSGNIFHANERFLTMLGYTKNELMGKHIFFVKEIKEAFQKDLFEVMHGIRVERELTLFGRDRHAFDIVAITGPLVQDSEIFGGFIILKDITERKKREVMLRERELLLSELVTKAGLGIVIINQEHQVMEANDRFAEMLGYTPDEILELHTWDWEADTPEEKIRESFADLSKVDTIFETRHRRKDGTTFDVEISAKGTSIHGQNDTYNAVICICRDISERKAVEKEIRYLSFHDSLTGLYNRRFFEEELRRLDVKRNLPISIIVGDVNGLKLTNDAFGHLQGDKLLQKAAKVMKKACRAEDIVARWGGDEFVIILPQTSKSAAGKIIERIKKDTEEADADVIKLSISLGVAAKETEKEDIFSVLVTAETIMYSNKLQESQNVIGHTIRIIHSTLTGKNRSEADHSRRVADYCKKIASAMGFSDPLIKEMEAAGLLHDIGKIGVEDGTLEKTTSLSLSEWAQIQRHPEVGYRILSASNDTADIAAYVLAHHEHYDGSGYPAGVKGPEIPLPSRILAVADAYDAMTSERPYRSAISHESAVKELQKNAGIQFDPDVVHVFVRKVLEEQKDPEIHQGPLRGNVC